MGDLLLVSIVASIMLGVGAIAWIGVRGLLRRFGVDQSTSARSQHRSGLLLILIGTFSAGLGIGAAFFGGPAEWLLLAQAVVLLLFGTLLIRDAGQKRRALNDGR